MRRFFQFAACVGAMLMTSLSLAQETNAEAQSEARARLEVALQSVVRIKSYATPNARSSATLGEKREGNGVLIERDLVLTIGYLVMEADEIEVTDARGKKLPAKVAGYDHATGFGLVRLIAPTQAQPIALGSSMGMSVKETLLTVPFGGIGSAQPSYLAAKKEYTGGWEYKLDEALFTIPPVMDWSGAGLFTKDGKLVGIGSLFLRDAVDDGIPGNMFVPIDLLKPILNDLKNDGRAKTPARPWLGVSTDARSRGLLVVRVSPDGPAGQAGLEVGDIIVNVGGVAVRSQSAFYDAVWSRGRAGVEIPITYLRDGDLKSVRIKSIDRMDFLKPKTTL